ncbi:MAG: haloacid dehalogenase [Nanopusillaceae archaeon]
MMIEKEYIDKLKDKFNQYEEKRDKVIQLGIKLNRLSKSVIYSTIRGDLESAKNYINEMKKIKEELEKIVNEEKTLYNNIQVNLQEYAEAMIFYYFITENKIIKNYEIEVEEYPYVMGLMDFVGELYRKSIEEMLKNNIEFAEKAREIIFEIYQYMLYMEFKNYDIRRKVDYVGDIYNLLTDKLFIRKSTRCD